MLPLVVPENQSEQTMILYSSEIDNSKFLIG
jgi:hypothetical protein